VVDMGDRGREPVAVRDRGGCAADQPRQQRRDVERPVPPSRWRAVQGGQVAHGIQRRHRPHLGVAGLAARRQRGLGGAVGGEEGQMATGRRPEQADASGVDPEACGVVGDPTDRAFDVPGRPPPARAGGRGQPVVDVEDHVPAASEPSWQQAAAPAPLVPTAPMHQHDGGTPRVPRAGGRLGAPHVQPPTHRGPLGAEEGDRLRRRPGGRAREIPRQGHRDALFSRRPQPVPNRHQRHHQGTRRHHGRGQGDAARPGRPRQHGQPQADPSSRRDRQGALGERHPGEVQRLAGAGGDDQQPAHQARPRPPQRHPTPQRPRHPSRQRSRTQSAVGLAPSSAQLLTHGPTVPDPRGRATPSRE
jgi:hypothetical protein